jgi:uncharacterized membrane protein YfcA
LNFTLLLELLIVFLGCFTQSLTGFGVALVTMALLPSLIGLQVATPLVALIGIVLEAMMLIRYRASLQFKSILGLMVSATVAIPLGVIYFRRLDEGIALFILGLIITMYALYSLIGFRLPLLAHSIWAWVFGFFGGLLGGAYNTSGPPAVVYGNCRKWSPQEFKSNLSGYFLVGSMLVVGTHWAGGNFTPEVWTKFWSTLPALLLGFLFGQGMDRWLNPETFRKIVLAFLVILGLRLMI